MSIKSKKKLAFLSLFLFTIVSSNSAIIAKNIIQKKGTKSVSLSSRTKKNELINNDVQVKSPKFNVKSNEINKFHPNDTQLSLVNDGEVSIKNLMIRGVNKIGKVMYIWGGGRQNLEGTKSRVIDTLGDFPRWLEFASEIDSKMLSDKSFVYNFKEFCSVSRDSNGEEILNVSYKHIDKGLDCSGFMAWLVKNTIASEDQKHKSFVTKARDMSKSFSDFGLGELSDFGKIEKIYPGDIISMNQGYDKEGKIENESHVYLALGQFNDGSVILLDMSPPTIRIRGTRDNNSTRDSKGNLTSEAIRTATDYMKNYFPDTYKLFPECTCSADDYKLDSKMHWDTSSPSRLMRDPEGYQKMTPDQILNDLLGPIPKKESTTMRKKPPSKGQRNSHKFKTHVSHKSKKLKN